MLGRSRLKSGYRLQKPAKRLNIGPKERKKSRPQNK
jgi:hypothetical protein